MVDFSYIENISIDFQTPRGYIISTNVHLIAHNRQTIGFLGTFLNIKTSLWIPYHQIKQSIGGISSFYNIYIILLGGTMLSCNLTYIHVVPQQKWTWTLHSRNKFKWSSDTDWDMFYWKWKVCCVVVSRQLLFLLNKPFGLFPLN